MNLSEALDAALPEIPRNRLSRRNPPRIDPDLIIREDVTDGEPIIAVYQRSRANLLRMKPTQWQLARMFDGVRTYEDIAKAFEAETEIPLTEEEVRTFAENMDEGGFWYQDPQEKNIAMNEKLAAQRSRRVHGTFSVAHIQFSAWDPDRYLTQLDARIGKFVFSRWITLATLLLFVFEAVVFIAKWNVLGPDIPLYYNFSRKTFSDLAEFWLLMMVIGFVHESAHGLTCKHYGGEVHSMGLMFLYLTPAFFVDVTESWISASRMQRLATIIAGIWVEMMLCGAATVIWTNTQPGEWIHDFSYKLILLTGLAVVVINLNPLIKLDGYYFFAEWLGIPDLKERSSAFVIAWVQYHIFRIPLDVPVVARRRVLLFVLYALASGAYSYLLLFFFVRFSYNVFSHWFAELALIPAGFLAFMIFRSRLRSLAKFSGDFYQANAGIFRLTPLSALLAALALALLFVPIVRDRENAWFVIEPSVIGEVHAGVTGKIVAVSVKEGETVRPGQAMASIESLKATAALSEAATQVASSQAQVVAAQLQHSGLGEALAAMRTARGSKQIADEESAQLTVSAPISGVVATREPESLLHRDVAVGQTLLTVMDPTRLTARLYLPASAMGHVRAGDAVSLRVPSQFLSVGGRLGDVDGSAVSLPSGILPEQEFKGMVLPAFYTTRMALGPSEAGLRAGMSGQAKIFGERRSVANRIAIFFSNVLRTHFW